MISFGCLPAFSEVTQYSLSTFLGNNTTLRGISYLYLYNSPSPLSPSLNVKTRAILRIITMLYVTSSESSRQSAHSSHGITYITQSQASQSPTNPLISRLHKIHPQQNTITNPLIYLPITNQPTSPHRIHRKPRVTPPTENRPRHLPLPSGSPKEGRRILQRMGGCGFHG